jgi:acetyl esterase/lipase
MPSEGHERIVNMLRDRPPRPDVVRHQDARAPFDEFAKYWKLADDVTTQALPLDGFACEWVQVPESRPDHAVLYMHGGGYVWGSVNSHRELVSRIARATKARVLNVGYRLAPEDPFPAALDDTVAAYRHLLRLGFSPGRIIVAGDSAGGGLTVATMVTLRETGEPLPAGGVCISPWADLEMKGDSAQPDATDDPMCRVIDLLEMGELYAGADAGNPLASPVHADLKGLPPLLIQAGTTEILWSDATRIAERAAAAGVRVTLEPWEGMVHVWHLFGVPESAAAIESIGRFSESVFASA